MAARPSSDKSSPFCVPERRPALIVDGSTTRWFAPSRLHEHTVNDDRRHGRIAVRVRKHAPAQCLVVLGIVSGVRHFTRIIKCKGLSAVWAPRTDVEFEHAPRPQRFNVHVVERRFAAVKGLSAALLPFSHPLNGAVFWSLRGPRGFAHSECSLARVRG